MLSAGAALIGIAPRGRGAWVVLHGWSRSRVARPASSASKLIADAERDAEAVRREAQVEAREQAVALRSEIESEVQDRRGQIAKIEERVLQKELDVDARLTSSTARAGARGPRSAREGAPGGAARDPERDGLARSRRSPVSPSTRRGSSCSTARRTRAPRARARGAADGGRGSVGRSAARAQRSSPTRSSAWLPVTRRRRPSRSSSSRRTT